MIYTLTLNPSIDFIIGVDGFEQGKVNRTTYDKMLPGGKGINVSIVLNNLGVETCTLGFVGGFTGEYIKNEIKKYGVKTDFVELDDCISRINVKIKSSEETEINASGPFVNDEKQEMLLKKIGNMGKGDVLVLAGSVPKGFEKTFYSDIISEISPEVLVVVDAEGELLTNSLKNRPFLIKPNNFELEGIFGVKINSKSEIVEYGRKLQKMGARNILVSMGGDGGIFICEDGRAFFSEAPKGKVINTTGAGDSTVAGFLAEFQKSGNYEKAFLFALSSGSASAFSEELATESEVLKLFEKISDKLKYL